MMRHTKKPLVRLVDQLEQRLDTLLPNGEPESLHRAMRYLVMPGGKRARPRLLLAVASACRIARSDERALALDAACAVEFIHAASLAHDDLPAFDNADQRRGRPTVHRIYGEPIALLVGDALLARAFEVIANGAPPRLSGRALRMIRLLGMLTGSQHGIIGGQSLECPGASFSLVHTMASVTRYHAMKTAALFRFAAEAGAIAAGLSETMGWADFGYGLGLAYQLGDDLIDMCGGEEAGKPVGQDATLGRPNAVVLEGELSARQRLSDLLERTRDIGLELAKTPGPILQLLDEIGGGTVTEKRAAS